MVTSSARAGFAVAAALMLAAGLGASQSPAARPPQVASIEQALDRYSSGEFDAAIAAVGPAIRVSELTSGAERWIAAGDSASRARRQLVAAAFALESAWAASHTAFNAIRTNPDPSKHSEFDRERITLAFRTAEWPVTAWAASQMPMSGAVHPAERLWWLAAIGVLGDCQAWQPVIEHVALARRRVPNEPRWEMAETVARAWGDLGTLRGMFIERSDVLREEKFGTHITRRIPGAQRDFQRLTAHAVLAGEAELRIGYLDLRRRQWSEALTRFDRTLQLTSDPYLLTTADYFTGWVHERGNRPGEAIAAYRRAHAREPQMRNLATLLAAQLFLAGDRTEAYAILDHALNAPQRPIDVLALLDRGEARFVPAHFKAMREALR